MFRRSARFACVAWFVLSVAACGGDDESPTGPSAPNDAQADHADGAHSDAPAETSADVATDSPTADTSSGDRVGDSIAPEADASDAPPDVAPAVDTGPNDVVSQEAAPDAGDARADAGTESGTDAALEAADANVDGNLDAGGGDGAIDSASTSDAGDAGAVDVTFDASDAPIEAAPDSTAADGSDGEAGTDPFACLGQPLPTTAPATVHVQGAVGDANFMAVAGATIDAFVGSSVTSSGTAISAADGTFAIDLSSGGVPLDAYLRATKTGFFDTYHYPAYPIATSPIGFTVQLIDTATFTGFALLSGVTPDASKGSMLLVAADCTGTGVAGATIGVAPAGTLVYLRNRRPAPLASNTDSDGAAVVFNVPPGQVTVSASVGGTTLRSHVVTVRANTVTRTSIRP